jgi:DNA segregation ATPase FtsK/SpoIIIE, S-DNA-T family
MMPSELVVSKVVAPVTTPRRLRAYRRWRCWVADRREVRAQQYMQQRLAVRMTDVLMGTALARRDVTGGGGPVVLSPQVAAVMIGPPLCMNLRLLPGQTAADVELESDRLAEAFGARRVRIIPRAPGWVRVELHRGDPLGEVWPLPWVVCESATDAALLGTSETGERLALSWVEAPHAVIQGQTRSGKSVFCYGLLGQLSGARDVVIAGCDPTGLLLGRPFAGTVHRPWQVAGMADLDAHVELLERLASEMDARISAMPDRTDAIQPDEGCPLLVVVLEEYPGLIRAATQVPKPKTGPKLVDRIQGAVGRLVSEGHKAGVRLVLIAQRADASFMGGYERGQFALRVSFAQSDPEALEMLHPGTRGLAEAHGAAPKGVALVTAPGRHLTRMRAPYMEDYGAYCDRIAAFSARLPHGDG